MDEAKNKINELVLRMMKAVGKADWQKVLSAIEEMKAIGQHQRFLTGAAKREWKRLIKSYELNAREGLKEEASRQVEETQRRLTKLTDILTKAKSTLRWKTVWDEVSELNSFFQRTYFLDPVARQKAWQRFQELVTDLKQLEKQDQENRREISTAALREITERALEARPEVWITEKLQIADLEDRKRRLQSCSQKLHQTWRLFHTKQLLAEHKKEAFTTLRSVQDELKDAWRALLRVWRRLYETNTNELAYKPDPRRMLELKLKNFQFLLAHSQAHLLALKEMNESANKDDFRRRTQDWIEEEKNKSDELRVELGRVKRSLQQLEE